MNYSLNLRNISFIAIATCSIGFGTFHSANAAEDDGRVKQALDSAAVEYTVTQDKTYKVVIKIKGGRTQVVLIDSKTSKIKGTNMEFREVYALAYQFNAALSGEMANKMMAQSHDKKIGAWEIIEGSSGIKLAVFTAKVDAELNGVNLSKIINSVGLVADQMENDLSGKDEY
jgi:hypothetical protein